MSRLWLVLLLATGLAAILRCNPAEERPMHNDEAVNAIKFGQLWEGKGYRYDPNEHHGPSLLYATLAMGRLEGAPVFREWTEHRLRMVPVVFGLALILLLPLVTDGLGRGGTGWAAVFTAVSPAFVFYSRYYIHEMLLVFFTFLALSAGWRYWRSRRPGWALLCGAGLGLMHGTKETFVLTLAAMGIALVLNWFWSRSMDASAAPAPPSRFKPSHLLAGFGLWMVVATALFTSFFANAGGIVDSVRTYMPWLGRAAGDSPHIHPWYFYLERLVWFHPFKGPVWTEALLLLLATVGAGAGFRLRPQQANASFLRFLALYTLLLMAIYSAIGYKTPWCLLSFWHGVILLAGAGAAVLVRAMRPGLAAFGASVLLLGGAGHLAWQAHRADTEYASDPRNPYVYAQTSSDILDLVTTVESLIQVSPQGEQTLVKVMAPDGDYWPLPWYLRAYPQIGWWEQVPEDPYAPVMILSPALGAKVDPGRAHLMGYYGLRPQAPLALLVDPLLRQRWVAAQPRPTRQADR